MKAQGTLLNNQKLNDKISQRIIATFGEKAWAKLSEESKLCLISGSLALNDMKQYSQLLDFSGACLQICKAVEVELTLRLFTEYVTYFKNKYGDEAEKKAPYDLLKYKDDKTKPKIFQEPSFVTIGNFRFFIGMTADGKIINKYAWREFSDYAQNALLIDPEQCEKTMAEHVQYITKIKDDYRNKSAHKSTLDVVQATECYNYIIGQYRRLGVMLDDYRF